MNRFFIDKSKICNETAHLEGDDVLHIQRVLRLSLGDVIELCDGMGMDYQAEIVSMDKKSVIATIISAMPSRGEPQVKVVLYQGIAKGAKMDTIIQKCVELGITEIIPVATSRTIVKLGTDKDEDKKTQRWQKIAYEAAKQSKRGIIPTISQPLTLEQAIMHGDYDIKLIPWEEECKNTLNSALDTSGKKVNSIAIFIGPEGGLEQSEISLAQASGWQPITLGHRIMRTETAGMAVLSAIMYHMEEWIR